MNIIFTRNNSEISISVQKCQLFSTLIETEDVKWTTHWHLSIITTASNGCYMVHTESLCYHRDKWTVQFDCQSEQVFGCWTTQHSCQVNVICAHWYCSPFLIHINNKFSNRYFLYIKHCFLWTEAKSVFTLPQHPVSLLWGKLQCLTWFNNF